MEKSLSDLIAENLTHAKSVARRFRRSREWQEDIVQEACLKAIQNFKSCKDLKRFKGWFGTIVYNTAITNIRDNKAEVPTGQDFNKFESEGIQQDQAIYDDYLNKNTIEMIKNLPIKQRKVFFARYFDGESFSSIAADMKCPYNTAKANYRHAMIKIKASIDRDDLG